MRSATGFMVRPKSDGVVFSVPQQSWYVTDGNVDLTVSCAKGQFFIEMRKVLAEMGITTVAAGTSELFDPENGCWMRELISEV